MPSPLSPIRVATFASACVLVIVGFSPSAQADDPDPCPMGYVLIEAGGFTMGSDWDEQGHFRDEQEVEVTLTQNFCMHATEVTQQQWADAIGTSPARFTECGVTCPVERVSWLDAVVYANARSEAAGLASC